jgi:hypothetical protein
VADPPSGGFGWAAAGDLNNDGWLDLVLTACSANRLYVLLNNQQGGFTVSTVVAAFRDGRGPEVVMLSDLNLDGNLDAVVEMYYGYAVVLYIGDGTGALHPDMNFEYYIGSYPAPPQVGDVNGDGIPDLLMPSSGSLGIAYGKGNGLFTPFFYVGVGNGTGQIILSDLHGQAASSGLPDIVSPDSTGGVLVLINTTKK